jgi:hypothetical protein
MPIRAWRSGLAGLVSLVGCAALASGCSTEATTGAGTSDQDITTIPETTVKDQSIGNCWIYATLGWVESLHLAHANETLDLSESYLTYLHAFTRITTGEFVFDKRGDWNTGDFFGEGAELIARFGMMDEAAFIASEAGLTRSARQEAATKAIALALKTGGELGTPEARKDPAKVRKVLDAAFALPQPIVDALTNAFGADLSKTRGHGAKLGAAGFRDPAKMIVAKAKNGHAVTLDEAMGELDPARPVSAVRDRKERRGPYAWQRVELEDAQAQAGAILRLKKTLNSGFPVPIDWYPAFASMREGDGSFHAPVRGEGGWHASLVHDYEIEIAGDRVLAAGTAVTDPALLEQTLAPSSTIKFLRLKNSWGRETGPLGARGYTDAMWDYLMWDFERPRIDYDEQPTRGVAISAVVVPPPSWEGATH